MARIWFEFILCSAAIVYCGTKLSRYGDVIAEKTDLGRAWIGLILMASVTSLPELITGISSVTIIALMDILHGRKPIFSESEHGHILSAGFGITLISIASISILANQNMPSIRHIGLYTPVIILIYAIGIRSTFLFERRRLK